MDALSYCIEPLNNEHRKTIFSCGIEPLDRYLIQLAGQDARRHLSATYVLTAADSKIILGYYTLSSSSIELSSLPEEMVKKLPRYPTLPATLLGRLAIDQKYQGEKLGELLLIDALKRSSKLSDEIALMAVIVEAKNEKARQFYLRFEFIQFSESKNQLFLPISTISRIWKAESKISTQVVELVLA